MARGDLHVPEHTGVNLLVWGLSNSWFASTGNSKGAKRGQVHYHRNSHCSCHCFGPSEHRSRRGPFLGLDNLYVQGIDAIGDSSYRDCCWLVGNKAQSQGIRKGGHNRFTFY